MATTLSSFRKDIILRVRKCPTPVIDHMLRLAAIDFCERSRVWQEDEEDLITTVDGTPEYTIASTSSEGEIAGIVELHFDDTNDTELGVKTEKELRDNDSGWRILEDKPTDYIQKDLTTVRLYPIPDDEYDIDGKLWLTPNKTGTTLPDFLYQEWREEIGWGALERILTLPEVWKDLDLALYYGTKFENGIDKALSQVLRQRTIASATIRPANVYT